MLSSFIRKILNLSFRYKEFLFQSCLLTNLNFLCDTVHPKCSLAFSNDVLSWPFFSGGKIWWWTIIGIYNLLHFACLHTASHDAGVHQASLVVSQYLGLSRREQDWPLEQKPHMETQPCSSAWSLWIQGLGPLESKSPQSLHGLQSAQWYFLLSASCR